LNRQGTFFARSGRIELMDSNRPRKPQEIWETALGEIQVQVNRNNYRTWFSKTSGVSFQDGVFVIGVPHTFAAEYLEKNQRSLIEKVLRGLTTPDVRVSFQVNGHQPAAEAALPALQPSFTKINNHYSFDSFIEGGCNRLARAAALSVSENPGLHFNPLFIYSGPGLGKTHLLHSIGGVAAARKLNVICTSAEQFTNEFVAALKEKSTEEFRNKYRSIGMLLVDDIHFISGKEQTEESFFHTFNALHNTNRQIVITSDRPPRSMPLLTERLRSRFEGGLIVDIQPPDFETRLAILRAKARSRGVEVPPDVLELIAGQSQSSIRSLEGSFNRVTAYARLLGAPPTAEIAARALSDVAARGYLPHDVTPALIIETVAGCFQISRDALLGRQRDKETALARRLAMYVMRQETNCSLAQIGLELGRRDAAAVTAACKKVTVDIEQSPYLKRKYDEIKGHLHAVPSRS
jgi:chromosomal replication initiator protein